MYPRSWCRFYDYSSIIGLRYFGHRRSYLRLVHCLGKPAKTKLLIIYFTFTTIIVSWPYLRFYGHFPTTFRWSWRYDCSFGCSRIESPQRKKRRVSWSRWRRARIRRELDFARAVLPRRFIPIRGGSDTRRFPGQHLLSCFVGVSRNYIPRK